MHERARARALATLFCRLGIPNNNNGTLDADDVHVTSFGGASQQQTPGEGGNGCFDHGSPGIPDLKAPFSVGVGGFGGPGVLGVSFPAGTAGTNGLIT